MSPTSTTDPTPDRARTSRELLVEDLERRIEILEALDDDAVGRFSGWDWLVCLVGAVIGPALAMWWFAG